MTDITPDEFKVISQYILDVSGISIGEGKEYLVESRLHPIMQEMECASFSELYHKTKVDTNKLIEKKIIDAITTNETYFFRDIFPFEVLQHKIIPDVIDKKSSSSNSLLPITIRIWCAASSTGQEVYSIAIILKELLTTAPGVNLQLIGTDISNIAISQASYGKYNKFEITRGLTQKQIVKYFDQDGDYWRIKDEIRSMVVFKRMNLLKPFVGIGPFDIIFCRNVAIYFTPKERLKLFTKLAGILESNGYLFIGSTESLTNDTDLFTPQKYLKAIFYQLKKKKIMRR